MSAAAVVTIVVAVLAVVIIATFLLGIAMVLSGVNKRLKNVTAAVDAIAGATEPIGSMVSSINRDLGAAHDVFESLLERRGTGTRPAAPGALDPVDRSDRPRRRSL